MRAMIDEDLVRAHRARGADPDRPVHARHGAESGRLFPGARGLQSVLSGCSRPSCRTPWTSSPGIVGRQYHLFDYVGAPDAERVIIMMGSGAEVAEETVDALVARGEKIGLAEGAACSGPSRSRRSSPALPASVKSIAVLDRTKEPGATGEPLYCDVITALAEMGVGQDR